MTKPGVSEFLEDVLPELMAVSDRDHVLSLTKEVQRRMGPGGVPIDWIKTFGLVVGQQGTDPEQAAFLRGLAKFQQRVA